MVLFELAPFPVPSVPIVPLAPFPLLVPAPTVPVLLPRVPVLPVVPEFGFILMSSGVVLVVPLFWLPMVPVLPVVPVFGFILMSSGVVLVVPLFWLPIDLVWPVVPLELWPDVPDNLWTVIYHEKDIPMSEWNTKALEFEQRKAEFNLANKDNANSHAASLVEDNPDDATYEWPNKEN